MTPLEEMPPPEDVLGRSHGAASGIGTMPPSREPQVAPPRKRKSGLIIGVIVVVLLLCCCVAGAFFFGIGWLADQDDATISTPPVSTTPPPASPGDDQARIDAWTNFAPELGAVTGVAPNERQSRVAGEIIAARFPGFTLVELLVEPGGVDEDGSFIADYFIVRLRAKGDSSVEIGNAFLAATAEWVDAGAEWVQDEIDENQLYGVLPDGTEYVIWTDAFPELIDGMQTPEYDRLLSQVAADWPGSVNTWVDYYEDVDGLSAWVYPTTWEQYVDVVPYDGFEAVYFMGDDGWYVESWDWFVDSSDEAAAK